MSSLSSLQGGNTNAHYLRRRADKVEFILYYSPEPFTAYPHFTNGKPHYGFCVLYCLV